MTISNNISSYLRTEGSAHSNDTKTFENSFEEGLMITQQEDVKDDKEVTQALIADIMSVLRTGHTVAELEEIEKLLQEIQKRIKEESTNKSVSTDDIKEMMERLERAIQKLQKDNSGVVIKEVKETNTTTQNTNTLSSELSALNERVKEAAQTINEIKKDPSLTVDPTNTHDELSLILQLKNLQAS